MKIFIFDAGRHAVFTTGYGQMSTNIAKRLDALGHDVYLQKTSLTEDKTLKKLEEKKFKHSSDTIYLWIRPPHYIKYPEFKPENINVFYTMHETETFEGWKSDWPELLNKCKAIIVPTKWNKDIFIKNNVNVPIYVLPLGVDTKNFYGSKNKNFTILSVHEALGRKGSRENWQESIQAYFELFYGNPDTLYLIKTWNEDQLTFEKFVEKLIIQNKWDWNKLPQYQVITLDLLPQDMNVLYGKAYLFLKNSLREGWAILEGTLVFTSKGLKPIEKISTKDKVLSHRGYYRKVKGNFKRNGEINVVEITPVGFGGKKIIVTLEHEILTTKRRWKEARYLKKGDYLYLPFFKGKEYAEKFNYIRINSFLKGVVKDEKYYPFVANQTGLTDKPNIKAHGISNRLEIDEDLALILGYYVSEGSHNHNTLNFSISSKEKSIRKKLRLAFKRKFELKENKSTIASRHRLTLHYCSSTLTKLFSIWCDNGAKNKKIPDFIMLAPSKIKKAFLKALWKGDGYSRKETFEYTTISPTLVFQLRLLLADLDIGATVSFNPKRKSYQVYVAKAKYFNRMVDITSEQDKKTKKLGIYHGLRVGKQGLKFRIREVRHSKIDANFYDLQTAEDYSYVTELFSVHNCLPLHEAMTCGIRILASNLPPFKEYAYPKLITYFSNYKELKEKLWFEYRQWRKWRSYVNSFSWKNLAQKLEIILKKVIHA